MDGGGLPIVRAWAGRGLTGFAALLNRLRPRLEGEGVPFVIGGSFALAARGHPRFTDDVDVMVLASDLAPVHRALKHGKFEYLNEVTSETPQVGFSST